MQVSCRHREAAGAGCQVEGGSAVKQGGLLLWQMDGAAEAMLCKKS